VEGHDPSAPALKLAKLFAYRPLALLGSGGLAGRIFDEVLSSSAFLLDFQALDDPESASLTVGMGVGNADGTYSLDPAFPPMRTWRVRIDGSTFESEPLEGTIRAQPSGLEQPVEIQVHTAVFAGEFTSPERCSVGQREEGGAFRLRGTLLGRLSVEEAEDTTIDFSGLTYTLCEILSGLLSVRGNEVDCDEVDEWAWPYPPDTVISDGEGGGELAWTLDADFAATAVRIAD
jgi:hypothetical protein